MLTIYSIVKGFDNKHIATIQRNAVQSWLWMFPDAQILWFGDDEPGAQEEADVYGVSLYPMERTESGAPLLPNVVSSAHELAKFDIRCLVNADIILEPSFEQAVRAVGRAFEKFLLVARRRCAMVDYPINFAGVPGEPETWHERLMGLEWKDGRTDAMDMFCYRGDWLTDIPPFGVGRTAWDNWILSKARREKVHIVDGTAFTRVLHQEHKRFKSQEEKAANKAMLRKEFRKPATLYEATHHVTEVGAVMTGAYYTR